MPLQNMVTRLNANYNARSRPVATIVAGAETGVGGRRVHIAANATTAVLQRQTGGFGSPWVAVAPAASVTQGQMTAFVNFITNGTFAPHQYRNVFNDPGWRAFYNAAPRVLQYVSHANAAVVKPAVDSVPCFDCELVLPVDNMTIDHQRPQAGNPVEPTSKIFRALGLTQGGASGPKGVHFQAAHMVNVGGAGGAVGATLIQKYTLNDMGQIYFTIADWCGLVDNSELDDACMHHVINLRPLCGACNTPNRNVRHF
jgi:hypothetical protein